MRHTASAVSAWEDTLRDKSTDPPQTKSERNRSFGVLGALLHCIVNRGDERMTSEDIRLDEAREQKVPWKKWGPYLSERQWGTVREDYSKEGDAWNFFTHDQARSRAYRWGEDGIAGISDDKQSLCFALAVWNGKDPIL